MAGLPFVVVVEPQQAPAVVVAGGRQGVAGRPGVPGPAGGSAFQRQAGESISALRVVYELDAQVFYLDYRDEAHIYLMLGLTLTSANGGDLINVQRSGSIDDASWSWTPGPVWLGATGALTQNPPADGFDVLIGAAVSATRITLNLQQPIELPE